MAGHLPNPTKANPCAKNLKPTTSPASKRYISNGSETEDKVVEEATKQAAYCDGQASSQEPVASETFLEEHNPLATMEDDSKTIHHTLRHQNQTNVVKDQDEHMPLKEYITWGDDPGGFSSAGGRPGSGAQSPPRAPKSPFSLLPHQQPMEQMHSDSSVAAALTFPAFSIRDPIVHFQPCQQLIRRTRDELVKRNNRAQVVKVHLPKEMG